MILTANHPKYANAEEGNRMDNDYGQVGRKGRSRLIQPVRIFIAFMQTERSLTFAYVRLKSLMFAYFEKKYFFPALRSAGVGTQGFVNGPDSEATANYILRFIPLF